MFTFILIVHVLICILLVLLVLMQSGRGGGLTESFSAAENMFGAKTDSMMVKATTILAFIFLVTSLGLAFLSAQQDKSLLLRLGQETQRQTFDPDSLFDDAAQRIEKIEINVPEAIDSSDTQTQD